MKVYTDVSGLADSIPRRCSIRKFMNAEIPADKMDTLKAYVASLNKDFPLIKIHICYDSTGFLKPLFFSIAKNGANTFVFEVLQERFPEDRVYVGLAGELLVLKATQLGLGTVWFGGDGFAFSYSKVQKAIGTTNPCPIVIPFGFAAYDFVLRDRKPAEKLISNWTGSSELLEAMRRAPSAINKQPWTFSGDNTRTVIYPPEAARNDPKVRFPWLDCGIATAHAVAFLQHKTINIENGAIIVTE